MKVLSFLEVEKMPYDEACDHFIAVMEIVKWNDRIVDFYSQPFKPELITELFERWSYNSVEGDFHKFYNGLNHIRIYPVTDDYAVIVYYVNFEETTNTIPRTLDDFITDCQRAGIELIWKNKEGGE